HTTLVRSPGSQTPGNPPTFSTWRPNGLCKTSPVGGRPSPPPDSSGGPMRSAVPFRATAVAAGLAIALLAASPAAAQWSSDPAVNTPVCTAPQSQYLPALVSSVDGGSIAVWDDLRSGIQTLYGQRFVAAGFAQWTPNGLPLAVSPGDMSVVPDGSGGVILAWFDSQSAPIALHAQRFDSNGAAQWSPG